MGKPNILIVEDDGILALFLADLLGGLNYSVLAPVATGEEALACALEKRPDLILMDIQLAGAMDGIQAAARIAEKASIPVVFLTSYAQSTLLERARRVAPYGYLVKPVAERDLAGTIETALYKHEADRKLRESEEKFRAIYEHNLDGILLTAPDGSILEANQSACRILGRSEAEITRLKRTELVEISDPRLAPALETRRQTGFFVGELIFFRANGEPFPVELSSSLYTTASGEVRTNIIFRDITERKRVEAILQESEASLRSLADTAPVLIWTAGPDARCTYFNRPWLEFTGRSLEQELGNGWVEGVHPQDVARSQKIFQEALQARRSFRQEYRLRRPSGEYSWVLDTGVPRFTPEGEFLGFIGTCVDITERRRMEKDLQAERDFARQVVNTMGQGLTVTGPQGQFEYVNPAYTRLLGYQPDELVGKSPNDVTVPADQAVLNQQFGERQTGKSGTYEARLVGVDGSQVPVLITAVPRSPEGPYSGAIAVITDLTEQKHAEKTIQALATRLETLLQTASDGIHVLDEEGYVLEVNDTFCRMLGYSRPKLLGMNVADWDLTWAGTNIFSKLGELLSHPAVFETRHRRSDGQIRDVEISTTGVVLEGQRYLYASARDITERKQVENELHRIRQELELANQKLGQALEREQAMARTDALTGVNNRRHLSELARHEFEVARRYQQSLAVIMFDIDHFKQVNDTCGHAVGDQILVQVTRAACAELRSADVIGRYGGDEFVVVLPVTDVQQAFALAERIREAATLLEVETERGPLSVTLSLGIAGLVHNPPVELVDVLIRQADDALYTAKAAGRNRTVIY